MLIEEQCLRHYLLMLPLLDKWSKENGMTVNIDKTTFQSFSLCHKPIHTQLKFSENQKENSKNSKCLGIIFDNKNKLEKSI